MVDLFFDITSEDGMPAGEDQGLVWDWVFKKSKHHFSVVYREKQKNMASVAMSEVFLIQLGKSKSNLAQAA